MNILTLDTVLNKSYIALLKGENKSFKIIESDENNYHSAFLIKVLKELLEKNEISLNEIDYLGVNTGVGSFTGIRVGLSAAKVISGRLNIKLIPLYTTEILKRANALNNVMLDARRMSVFYSGCKGQTELLTYNKALNILKNSEEKFICDSSLLQREEFMPYKSKLISYETNEINLAEYELIIAKEKAENKIYTDSNSIKPTYIQTPPIFSKVNF